MNLRPSGYEPDELPGCSTPRWCGCRCLFGGTGGDLLSRALRRSTIGAEVFHVRVRDGIGCFFLAIAARPSKQTGPRGIVERGIVCRCMAKAMQLYIHYTFFERVLKFLISRILAFSRHVSEDEALAYRVIRTSQLHALLRFHTWPIDVVVFHDSQRDLILRLVSRLDAFSGYPFPT